MGTPAGFSGFTPMALAMWASTGSVM